MSDATTPTSPPQAIPPLPYTVQRARVGPGEGKLVLFKVYPGEVPGDYLSDDEARMWEHTVGLATDRQRLDQKVEQLADEVAALKLRLADAEAELAGAVPHPTDAMGATGGAKKGKGAK